MKISVFTVCMPEYTPEQAAARLARWKADGVEWRVHAAPAPGAPVRNFWNGNRCSVDPETIVEHAPNLRALCQKHRLAMPVLATYLGYRDLDLIERVCEAATVTGSRGVRVDVDQYDGKTRYEKALARTLKGWEKVVRIASQYRVKPLAEIHMGNIIPSASAAWRMASHFAPSEVGIIHDAGNMVYEGFENWQMGMEILGRHLAHVHVKNSSWSIDSADRDGNLRWSPKADSLRHGRVDWVDVLQACKRVGYGGWVSVEDFSDGNTDDKIPGDIKYLRQIIGRR